MDKTQDSEAPLIENTDTSLGSNPIEDVTHGGLSLKDPGTENRGEFNNNLQYILTCIGYAVGLGNIWRFPAVAYKNGGGAFLFPYIIMGLLFGLPALYMEVTIGQFTQSGPSIAFRRYFPLLQGLGWTMSVVSLTIAIFYNVIVAWSLLYMANIVLGMSGKWALCDNEWNDVLCDSSHGCSLPQVFFNGSCMDSLTRSSLLSNPSLFPIPATMQSATDQFFTYHILNKHLDFSFGEFQWQIAVALTVCWCLTACGLVFGVKWLGRISMVTATLPYLMMAILLVRGVTLEGAYKGIEWYLVNPDFSKILEAATWKNALTQLSFSLSVGLGGMLAMASYNRRSHNAYRDAVIIVAADSGMSIVGGIAVFSTLGFMMERSGKTIDEIVPSPLALAFIVYPEALSHMPLAWIWAFLFFFTLFLLGLATMFGYVEAFVTCLTDQFVFFRGHHALTVGCVCFASNLVGILLFCSQNGYHFFNIFNEYIGSFALGLGILIEVGVIVVYYGPRGFFRDAVAMYGPPTGWFTRIFGSSGWMMKATMTITVPLCAIGAAFTIIWEVKDSALVDKIGSTEWPYPAWAIILGLFLGGIPLICIPLFAFINWLEFSQQGKSVWELFNVEDVHPALLYHLSPPPSVAEFISNPIGVKREVIESKKEKRKEKDWANGENPEMERTTNSQYSLSRTQSLGSEVKA